MTFPTQIPSITYNGDNVTTSWVYNFEIPYQSDGITPAVRVYLTNPTGINTVLVLGTDYVINNVGNLTGGTIVTASTVAPGWTITIQRALHVDQLTAFPNQGFLASDIEAALDKLTMLVQDASLAITSPVSGPTSGVTTFNGRAGTVTLTGGDITSAGGALSSSLGAYAPLNSPGFSGNPTAPTPTVGNNSTSLATTAFVASAIASIPTGGVSSFNTRTGAVTFQSTDITGVGGALLASPIFTGTPQAPTALAGTNNTQLATTQFVTAAIAAIPGGSGTVTNVSSATADLTVATPTSTPVLTVNSAPKWSAARTLSFTGDVTGSGSVDGSAAVATGLTLATVNSNVGTFGDATHVPQITLDGKGRVTAASSIAITGGGTVTSVGLAMPVDFTVTNSPVTGSGTLTAAWNSQSANLVFASPSGSAGVPGFRALTTTDIPSLSGTYVPLTGGTMTGQLTVGGPTGIRFNKAAGANNNILFGATAGSNRWQVILGNSTTEGGSNAGSDFNINAYSDTAALLGTALSITRSNMNATFAASVSTTSGSFVSSATAGANRGLYVQTAGSPRWFIGGDGTAESGSNAGTNFIINNYTDGGVAIGTPLSINRATGNATFSGNVAITNQTINIGPNNWPSVILSKNLNSGAQIFSQVGSNLRWNIILGDNATESGGNAGSNFLIQGYNDSGTSLGNYLTINRANGVANFFSTIYLGSYPSQGTLQPVVGYFVSGSWWNAERMSINVSGTTAQAYYNSGGTTVTWSLSASDRRMKSNIKPAKNAIDFIKKIKVYDLDFKSKIKPVTDEMPEPEKEHWPFSMIADEVAKLLPHATIKVKEDDGEHHVALHPTHLISVLWKAVQELTARVEELETNARAQS